MMQTLYCTFKGIHKSENQDCYSVVKNRKYSLYVVADGLGSSSKSAVGSRLICSILKSYIKEYISRGLNFIESTIDSVICRWEDEVLILGSFQEFRTTCSFLLIQNEENRFLFGKIGDSMIAILSDKTVYMKKDDKEFLNETSCLGIKNVKFECISGCYQSELFYLIATDGISDELNTSKIEEFFQYLYSTYNKLSSKECNKIFRRDIKETFFSLNSDDKTIITGWDKI